MKMPLLSGNPLQDMIESFKKITWQDYWANFRMSGTLLSSLLVMAIIMILAMIVGIQAKRQDPMKPSRGLLAFAEMGVDKLQNWTRAMMGGREPGNWPAYFLCLTVYLFMAFTWSLTGLPSIIDTLIFPLSLSVVMFILIHATAVRYQKWKYFHRYIEPIPIFLPINLITMWTPIISTALRMFGNALSGSVVIGLLNWALKNVSISIFSEWASSYMAATGGARLLDTPAAIWLSPLPIGVLNLYFGLFSGFIQTLVFASLNACWITAEMPEANAMGTERQVTRPGPSKAQ